MYLFGEMISIGNWLTLERYPLKVYRDYTVYSYIEYQSVYPFVGIVYPHPLTPQTCVSPPGTQREEQHTLASEGVGASNSDDWKENLALCS